MDDVKNKLDEIGNELKFSVASSHDRVKKYHKKEINFLGQLTSAIYDQNISILLKKNLTYEDRFINKILFNLYCLCMHFERLSLNILKSIQNDIVNYEHINTVFMDLKLFVQSGFYSDEMASNPELTLMLENLANYKVDNQKYLDDIHKYLFDYLQSLSINKVCNFKLIEKSLCMSLLLHLQDFRLTMVEELIDGLDERFKKLIPENISSIIKKWSIYNRKCGLPLMWPKFTFKRNVMGIKIPEIEWKNIAGGKFPVVPGRYILRAFAYKNEQQVDRQKEKVGVDNVQATRANTNKN
jgi:hypothetical protein